MGAGLTFTLFDGLARPNRIHAAKKLEEQAESMRQKLVRDLETLVSSKYQEVMNASEQFDALQASLNQADENIRVRLRAFEEGLATILLVLAGQACGLILVVLNPSLRMALSAASFYAGTAFAFVGLTFPQTGMPALAKAWSNLLPLTHYLHIFLAQTFRGADPVDSIPDMLFLCVFMLLGLLLTPRLKRSLTDSRYWGRP